MEFGVLYSDLVELSIEMNFSAVKLFLFIKISKNITNNLDSKTFKALWRVLLTDKKFFAVVTFFEVEVLDYNHIQTNCFGDTALAMFEGQLSI